MTKSNGKTAVVSCHRSKGGIGEATANLFSSKAHTSGYCGQGFKACKVECGLSRIVLVRSFDRRSIKACP